jgi:hypothetical protein
MWNETVQQLQAADPARFGSSAMNLYFDGKSVRRSDGVPLRKSALTTTRVWAIDFYGYNQGFNLLGIANIDIQYKAGELKEVIDAVKSITGSKKGHPCRPEHGRASCTYVRREWSSHFVWKGRFGVAY